MLELWGMRSTPSLPSLPGSRWSGVVASDRVLSMGQIKLNSVLMLNWIVWNRNIFVCVTELFEIEQFLTLKLYLRKTELFEIERFWQLTFCKKKTILISNYFFLKKTVWVNSNAWYGNVFLQLNCVVMLNWMVWNRTVYLHQHWFSIKYPAKVDMP